MKPAPEVLASYERFCEETRLDAGPSRLEFERTKTVLSPGSACTARPGGRRRRRGRCLLGWLAEQGYEVHPGATSLVFAIMFWRVIVMTRSAP
jgi:hypothetical protein